MIANNLRSGFLNFFVERGLRVIQLTQAAWESGKTGRMAKVVAAPA